MLSVQRDLLMFVINIVILVKRVNNWWELSCGLILDLLLKRISSTEAVVELIVENHWVRIGLSSA